MSDKVLDYEETILAGMIPLSPDQAISVNVCIANFDYLSTRISPEVFSPIALVLFNLISVCRNNGTCLTEDILVDHLQRESAPPEKIVDFQHYFDRLRRVEVSGGKFRYVMGLFFKEKEESIFKQSLADAFTIVDKGSKIGRQHVKGVSAAKSYLSHALFQLDQFFASDVPHGNIREDGAEVWSEYVARRDNPITYQGIKTGFSVIDRVTNGASPGELWLIAGFAGQGKSNTLINMIHNAAVVQGKNVVVAVNEMVYRQYRVRLFIRHSCHEKFGLAQGISYTKFKMGTLNPIEEKAFQEVIQDFESNPAYGRVEVFQIPGGAGFDFVTNRLVSLQSMFPVDILFIDYLALIVDKNIKVSNKREYLDPLIVRTKQFATTFDKGRGIPIISPWQINRTAFKDACLSGKYKLDCLAEAPEAERSTDVALWLLRRDEEIARSELRAGIMKYRDGHIDEEFTLFEDFDSYFVGDVRESGSSMGGLTPAAGGASSLYE